MSNLKIRMIDTNKDKTNGKELEIFYLTWPNLYRITKQNENKNESDKKTSTN